MDVQLTYTLDFDGGTDVASSVAWSPDGQHIAYAGQVTQASNDIIVQVLDSSNLDVQLTYTRDWDGGSDAAWSIAWSPDGQQIAYAGSVTQASRDIIVQVLTSTTLDVQLTYTLDLNGNTDQAFSVAWSPDGQQIAYAGQVTQASNDIIVQVLDSSNLNLLLSYILDFDGGSDIAISVAWSPNGQQIAYAGQVRQASSNDIIVQVLDASNLDVQLTYILDFDGGIDVANSVAWSPDGQQIVYAGQITQASRDIIAQVLDSSNLDVQLTYTLDFDGGTDNANSVVWSPDGQQIAYAGQVTQASSDIIVQVLNFVSALNCSVINNEVSNCTADQDGIGLEGNDISNLIIKNVAYNNDTNFSGVTNVFTGGISGTPGNLQNIDLSNS